MKTINSASDAFILSSYPIPLTVDEVESLLVRLKHNDKVAKKLIICLIEHRLNHRYIRPLLNVPVEFKSGFLMMAASCLLIETLQSFYEGENESEEGSGKAFGKFFASDINKPFFPGFAECFPVVEEPAKGGKTKKYSTFYKHIRCGILHQAETTGGYSILRRGPLFDKDEQAINANLFVKALGDCVERYLDTLRIEECSSPLWQKSAKKIEHICKNCQS